ncbi:MAG TPA: polysaccharide deacetylase family protein [Saprospiraceae bacterium]|nr:polysaccharide deacetylase family protein [Saprospiraceae bacterium]
MFFAKTPLLVKALLPQYIWHIPTSEKVVYLTFDDGPIPEATPWVLDLLLQFGAKATFFCVGDNVRKHPEVFQRILQEGHAVGNHTYNHLNGWKTQTFDYLKNVQRCGQMVDSPLFRPPYGALRPSQTRTLKSRYRIVMWDVLSGDYDPEITPEQCLENVLDNVRPGSIILFHDSLKAEARMRYALPKVLEQLGQEGWTFRALEN